VQSSFKSGWNPEFIAWGHVDGRGREGPKKTLYQRDFCQVVLPSKLLQGRDRFSENQMVSSYKEAFSHGEPRKESSVRIQKEMSARFFLQNQHRAKTCLPREKSSVASCMIWRPFHADNTVKAVEAS